MKLRNAAITGSHLEFEMVLNPDQQETWARIRRFARMTRRYERIIPAFRAVGLLGGGR